MIEEKLKSVSGHLLSINRNTLDGWYELEIGLPDSWVFNENNEIGCEIITKSDAGKLIKIFPKKNTVIIDDLILFVEIIIKINEQIAEKEKQFISKIEETKKQLEIEAKEFYKELDLLKTTSFEKLSSTEEKKRGRKPKNQDIPEENVTESTKTDTTE